MGGDSSMHGRDKKPVGKSELRNHLEDIGIDGG
jgi:hypothetical protein